MNIEKLNSKEGVYNFLQEHAGAVLSTVSPDGTPYASPIYFIVDKELNFFFLTKSDTKKAQNIEKNNHVALTVVHPSLPITVQATGTVEEVQEPEILIKMAKTNANETGGFSWPPPLSKLISEGYLLMYKVTPHWLRIGDFATPQQQPEKPTKIFYEIIPQK